jgi:thiol:disulfide interchange protein
MESERLMPVLEVAQQKRLPVFVEFHAEWCAPCKIMEEELFTQEAIFVYFNSFFINFRTNYDAESGRALADIYEVKSLPTILFLDPQGVVLERHSGSVTSGLLRSMGDSARAKMR